MSSRNGGEGFFGSDARLGLQAGVREEDRGGGSVRGRRNYVEQVGENMMRSPGYEVCKNLIRELDPEYRRRYLSGRSSPETKKQTKLVQELILSMVRQGPARECIEEMAAKRSDLDSHDAVHLDVNMGLGEQECDAKESAAEVMVSSSPRPGLAGPADISGVFLEVCDLFAIANDDDSFAFICMLFDEGLQSKFREIAGPYMEKYRECNSLHLTNVMRDVLEHAQWKCFGGQDASEHHKREAALLRISDIVRSARAAYGLTPYTTVRCRFQNRI